jgi:hypothetical protein
MKDQILNYISLWERRCYSNGLPAEVQAEIDYLVPSYKRICIAIMKGDLEYIGISKPVSQYYGMLKCIELGKQYKKSKTMTRQQTKEYIFRLINTLVEKQCYIKGYGEKFRICDNSHNPIMNISKQHFNILLLNNIVMKEGLIHILAILENPFKHQTEITLPQRHEV